MPMSSKKDKILTVSTEHFSKLGYENTNLEAIAKECSVTKPAIYYHFKDKATLYKNITCPMFLQLSESIEASTNLEDATKNVQMYISTFGEFLISNPSFSSIFAREIASGGTTFSNECAKYLSRTLSRLRNILEDGHKNGIFEKENPFMIQMMIVSTLTSYNTTKPLREKVAEALENRENLPNPDFKNIITSLSEKIIKGLTC